MPVNIDTKFELQTERRFKSKLSSSISKLDTTEVISKVNQLITSGANKQSSQAEKGKLEPLQSYSGANRLPKICKSNKISSKALLQNEQCESVKCKVLKY